jgi:HD-GYP domain-containing protein (c-di-GMP phosphodiesterase class II)
MKIRMDILCRVFSKALDLIEKELFGSSENHSMRVAVLCVAMGRRLCLNEGSMQALAVCALFHDNALTEYMLSERSGHEQAMNMRLHCEYGQNNVEWLPFKTGIENFIRYHHERADGRGPFRKSEGECPIEAELIAIADAVDVANHLQLVAPEALAGLRSRIASGEGRHFTSRASAALLDVLDLNMLVSLRDDFISETVEKSIPIWEIDGEDTAIIGIAGLFAHIIDYKSVFTKKHTVQIANRSWLMADYYGYDQTLHVRLFLAAALHDIGKIATPVDILEKKGKLDHDEFEIIKLHVRHTYDWLSGIPGFEDICDWASNHHEKLNGSGYSFGKGAQTLDFNSRLMACIDIYQAVSEERPYHPRRSHEETMPILWGMAQQGLIDEKIVGDLDVVMAEYSNRDVPHPPLLQNFHAYERDN